MIEEKIKGMIGVEDKDETFREAKASAEIKLHSEIINKINEKKVPKGDVLEQSRVAGIIAAKKTAEIIPLCHPLRLTNVKIDYEFKNDGIVVKSYVAAKDRTGVEMEALSAAVACCLNIYDMCKMFDREMSIENVVLLEKKGGRSGNYVRSKKS